MTDAPVLTELFEIELQYREGMARVMDGDDLDREYVGSGDGTVTGPDIAGTVRWDIYEEWGDTRCDSRIVGIIETEGGAEITVEAVGMFVRVDPPSEQTDWRMVAGVRFDTKSPEYGWLNDILATWGGEMDGESFHHRYRVYEVAN